MAINYKNARLVLTTATTDLYTCPALTTAIVTLCQAANVTTAADKLTVSWTDASNGNAVTRLVNGTPVAASEAQGVLVGKLVLEAGDKIRASCATVNAIEITASVVEFS